MRRSTSSRRALWTLLSKAGVTGMPRVVTGLFAAGGLCKRPALSTFLHGLFDLARTVRRKGRHGRERFGERRGDPGRARGVAGLEAAGEGDREDLRPEGLQEIGRAHVSTPVTV